MSALTLEHSGTPPEGNSSDVEIVTATVLNTRFGDALKHPGALDRILPVSFARHLALVGFSEVTPGVRDEAVATIEARGYKALVPEGNIDTVWAISTGLEVEPEATATHPFPGRIASRPGKRQKRDAGMQTIVVATPGGHRLRASTERLAPPIIGRRARHRQLGYMATILDKYTPLDPGISLDINGGDQNHANGPTSADRALWEPRGYKAVLQKGTPTYTLEKGSKTAKVLAWMFGVVRKTPNMHFDEMYLRPGLGHELAPSQTAHMQEQIGYAARVVSVEGTDHHAIETTITLPPVALNHQELP